MEIRRPISKGPYIRAGNNSMLDADEQTEGYMRDSDSEREESDGASSESIFSCPACGQEISVNEEMKDAILTNGCPVCATSVGSEYFDD